MARQTAKKTEAVEKPVETKRDKFKRVITPRVGNALQKIALIRNGANLTQYEFTEADVDKMKKALLSEVAGVIDAYEAALEGRSAKSGGSGFNFADDE